MKEIDNNMKLKKQLEKLKDKNIAILFIDINTRKIIEDVRGLCVDYSIIESDGRWFITLLKDNNEKCIYSHSSIPNTEITFIIKGD